MPLSDAEFVQENSSDSSISGAVSQRTPYAKSEDEKIISYIVSSKSFDLVKGRLLYQTMEKERITSRSWQSMYERFRQNILPNIQSGCTYGLNTEVLKAFPEVTNTPKSTKTVQRKRGKPVSKEEVAAIADLLLNHEGPILGATGEQFWKNILEKNTECKKEPKRCVHVYRKHIDKKVGEINITSAQKLLLESKLLETQAVENSSVKVQTSLKTQVAKKSGKANFDKIPSGSQKEQAIVESAATVKIDASSSSKMTNRKVAHMENQLTGNSTPKKRKRKHSNTHCIKTKSASTESICSTDESSHAAVLTEGSELASYMYKLSTVEGSLPGAFAKGTILVIEHLFDAAKALENEHH